MTTRRWAEPLSVGCAAALIFVSRFATRPGAPDDYDAIGFVRALDEFDLDRFQPHFPGYPVYVALGRLAHLLFRDPLAAATAVSAAAAAATAIGLWWALDRLASRRAAWIAIGLYAVAALPLLTGGAALSDGTAAAFAVLAGAALVAGRPLASGVLIALMLGTRASYLPLALSFGAGIWIWRRPALPRALVGAAIGTLSWSVPLLGVVGARHLVDLGCVHLRGHFGEFGGSIVTRPDLAERSLGFARDLFFDGVAPSAWALAAFAVVVAVAARHCRPSRAAVAKVLVLLLPYALWVFVAQNIVEQPRHLLPLVIALIALIAVVLDGPPLLSAVAIAIVAVAALPVALLHRRENAAAAEMAAWVASSYRPGEVAVFGGRSIRFVHQIAPGILARERTWLSEVDVALEREDRLPPHVLVTSEVEPDPRREKRLVAVRTFCRDPRLDRRQACLQLFEYGLGAAPAQR